MMEIVWSQRGLGVSSPRRAEMHSDRLGDFSSAVVDWESFGSFGEPSYNYFRLLESLLTLVLVMEQMVTRYVTRL